MDRVREGYRKSVLIMVIFSLIMFPVMQITSEGILSLFVEERAVIEMGARALRITSIFYMMLGMIYVVRGVLNGLGDSVFALINGIVEVIGRFTVPIYLVTIPFIGMWGIWWSVGIVWSMAGITAVMRYLVYRKKVLRTVEM